MNAALAGKPRPAVEVVVTVDQAKGLVEAAKRHGVVARATIQQLDRLARGALAKGSNPDDIDAAIEGVIAAVGGAKQIEALPAFCLGTFSKQLRNAEINRVQHERRLALAPQKAEVEHAAHAKLQDVKVETEVKAGEKRVERLGAAGFERRTPGRDNPAHGFKPEQFLARFGKVSANGTMGNYMMRACGVDKDAVMAALNSLQGREYKTGKALEAAWMNETSRRRDIRESLSALRRVSEAFKPEDESERKLAVVMGGRRFRLWKAEQILQREGRAWWIDADETVISIGEWWGRVKSSLVDWWPEFWPIEDLGPPPGSACCIMPKAIYKAKRFRNPLIGTEVSLREIYDETGTLAGDTGRCVQKNPDDNRFDAWFAGDIGDIPADLWRANIKKFANDKWPVDKLGPAPRHPKCVVPRDVIAEMRLDEIYTPQGFKRD